ncbi:MAG: hypothetical protein QG671_4061 [Actinomycetota bacterium]|nr:hypothetical protein [Actinomycetota bacterium]
MSPDIARQVEVILAARATELGKRAVLVEVFSRETAKRLADLLHTTAGPVVVTYRPEPDRVTGDLAAIVAVTGQPGQRVELADGAGWLTVARLSAVAAAGKRKMVLYCDSDAWADARLDGYPPGAPPLAKAAALRNRLRAILRAKRKLGYPGGSIADTERRLAAAETDYAVLAERTDAHRHRRRASRQGDR